MHLSAQRETPLGPLLFQQTAAQPRLGAYPLRDLTLRPALLAAQ